MRRLWTAIALAALVLAAPVSAFGHAFQPALLELADEGEGTWRMTWKVAVQGTGFLVGDIDRNGRVDGADLVLLTNGFGSTPNQRRFRADADLDGNRVIDGEDLAILAQNFGRSSV